MSYNAPQWVEDCCKSNSSWCISVTWNLQKHYPLNTHRHCIWSTCTLDTVHCSVYLRTCSCKINVCSSFILINIDSDFNWRAIIHILNCRQTSATCSRLMKQGYITIYDSDKNWIFNGFPLFQNLTKTMYMAIGLISSKWLVHLLLYIYNQYNVYIS